MPPVTVEIRFCLVELIGTALQSWTIIVGFAVLPILALISRRGSAQAGLVAVLFIQHLALVLDLRQAGFHLVELRSGHDILLACRQDFGDLLLRLLDPLRSLRMAGKSLGQRSGLLLLPWLDLLKEVDESIRVVA